MKACFTLLALYLTLPFPAIASEGDTAKARESRFYTGMGLTTITYHIYYKNPTVQYGSTGYFTPVFLNVGYKASRTVRLQSGIAYGGSKSDVHWSLNDHDDDTLQIRADTRTHVLAVPVTIQVDLFRRYTRIPFYGTVSAITAFGRTNGSVTEILHGVPTTEHVQDKGINIFLMAGLGVNYKISKRFRGYTELFLFKKNLIGDNSFDYDWEAYSPWGRRLFRSFAFGVNYQL
ncbi:hypothetical protein [uncultured Pontibacter sp.]|uniref:hypothetical protein n=1 Tax=uncultured Pontibacter sp. TaxID=453356 RepID=UPI00261BA2BC|nr:hypothetical protein [uncultured Pontibacter sp.]